MSVTASTTATPGTSATGLQALGATTTAPACRKTDKALLIGEVSVGKVRCRTEPAEYSDAPPAKRQKLEQSDSQNDAPKMRAWIATGPKAAIAQWAATTVPQITKDPALGVSLGQPKPKQYIAIRTPLRTACQVFKLRTNHHLLTPATATANTDNTANTVPLPMPMPLPMPFAGPGPWPSLASLPLIPAGQRQAKAATPQLAALAAPLPRPPVTMATLATSLPRPTLNAVIGISASGRSELMNGFRLVKELFFEVAAKWHVPAPQARMMSDKDANTCKRAAVRLVSQSTANPPKPEDLFVVAADLCLILHVRRSNVAKFVSRLPAEHRPVAHVPRSPPFSCRSSPLAVSQTPPTDALTTLATLATSDTLTGTNVPLELTLAKVAQPTDLPRRGRGRPRGSFKHPTHLLSLFGMFESLRHTRSVERDSVRRWMAKEIAILCNTSVKNIESFAESRDKPSNDGDTKNAPDKPTLPATRSTRKPLQPVKEPLQPVQEPKTKHHAPDVPLMGVHGQSAAGSLTALDNLALLALAGSLVRDKSTHRRENVPPQSSTNSPVKP